MSQPRNTMRPSSGKKKERKEDKWSDEARPLIFYYGKDWLVGKKRAEGGARNLNLGEV